LEICILNQENCQKLIFLDFLVNEKLGIGIGSLKHQFQAFMGIMGMYSSFNKDNIEIFELLHKNK
jgi:hypothetical protein